MGWFGSVLSVTRGGENFQMVSRTLDFEHDEMSGKERKSWCTNASKSEVADGWHLLGVRETLHPCLGFSLL